MTAELAEQMLESGASLVDILSKMEEAKCTVGKSARTDTETTVKNMEHGVAKLSKASPSRTKRSSQKSKSRVIDRRRRKGQRLESSGSSDDSDGRLSDGSLSLPSDDGSEDCIQVLESLSESSDSDSDCGLAASMPSPRQPNITSDKPAARGRRQIVLAASFNLAPPTGQSTRAGTAESSLLSGQGLLNEVYSEAVYQTTVHTALCILSEDSYLSHIKLFTEWLHTYSIVIATCRKVHTCIH